MAENGHGKNVAIGKENPIVLKKEGKPSGITVDPLTGLDYSDLYRSHEADSARHYETLKDRNKRIQSLMDLDPRTTEAMLLNIAGAWEAGEIRKQFNEVRENTHSKYLALSEKKAKDARLKAQNDFLVATYSKGAIQAVLRDNPHWGEKKYPFGSDSEGAQQQLGQAEERIAREKRDRKNQEKRERIEREDFKDLSTRIRTDVDKAELKRIEVQKDTTKRNREILDRLLERYGIKEWFVGQPIDLDIFANKYVNHKGIDGKGQGLKDVIERIAHSPYVIADKPVNMEKVRKILRAAGYMYDPASLTNFDDIGNRITSLRERLGDPETLEEDKRKLQQEINMLEEARNNTIREVQGLLQKNVPYLRDDRFQGLTKHWKFVLQEHKKIEEDSKLTAAEKEEKIEELKRTYGTEEEWLNPLDELAEEFKTSYQRGHGREYWDEWLDTLEGQRERTGLGRSHLLGSQSDRERQLKEAGDYLYNLDLITPDKVAIAKQVEKDTLAPVQTEPTKLTVMNPSLVEEQDAAQTEETPEKLNPFDTVYNTGGAFKPVDVSTVTNKDVGRSINEASTGPHKEHYRYDVSPKELLWLVKLESRINNYSPNTAGASGEIGSFQILPSTAKGTDFGSDKTLGQIKKELTDPDKAVIYAAQILSDIKAKLKTMPTFFTMKPKDRLGIIAFAYNAGITRTLKVLKKINPDSIPGKFGLAEFLAYKGKIAFKSSEVKKHKGSQVKTELSDFSPGITDTGRRYVKKAFEIWNKLVLQPLDQETQAPAPKVPKGGEQPPSKVPISQAEAFRIQTEKFRRQSQERTDQFNPKAFTPKPFTLEGDTTPTPKVGAPEPKEVMPLKEEPPPPLPWDDAMQSLDELANPNSPADKETRKRLAELERQSEEEREEYRLRLQDKWAEKGQSPEKFKAVLEIFQRFASNPEQQKSEGMYTAEGRMVFFKKVAEKFDVPDWLVEYTYDFAFASVSRWSKS